MHVRIHRGRDIKINAKKDYSCGWLRQVMSKMQCLTGIIACARSVLECARVAAEMLEHDANFQACRVESMEFLGRQYLAVKLRAGAPGKMKLPVGTARRLKP